ncbi:hypothetical protein GH809_10490 [Klebsiella pneumoniae]|uniref:hypothetical protein n=1 Tax=Klebsiella pneumoniae TaxID=573 RepID=UPI000DA7F784|nr:hypothetical protein [Klebsiella pneumoniae]MRJ50635.1 hypothetical protein [Klebsiella pneumoniae]PZE00991.1 hypothetical protein DND31_12635 [Klebsiella pneumoniae]PZE06706.1 hypothetical protein DND32_12310 [Klebsiella pneumoniae]
MTSKFNIDNRELLQKISSGEAVVGIDFGNLIVRELAAFRLAAMENEPLAVTDDELNAALQLHRLKVDGHSQLSDSFRAGFRYARRTTPQPAPVVPEEATPDSIEILASARRRDHAVFQWDEDQRNAAADSWNACRAAMLQASPVCTCPSGDGSLRWPCPVHPGNSPVIPEGWKLVPVEPNGDMLAAAQDAYGETEGDIASTLRAAIAAVPQENN